MSDSADLRPVPALPFIHIDESGRASLRGSRCGACGAVLLGKPLACSACGSRRDLLPIELSNRGTLHAYTIVHRSFPGVKTPFVAAIIDLEGGGSLKGTLLDVAPDPSTVRFDMPLEVIFRDSGQRDATGRPYLTYFFTAREAAT